MAAKHLMGKGGKTQTRVGELVTSPTAIPKSVVRDKLNLAAELLRGFWTYSCFQWLTSVDMKVHPCENDNTFNRTTENVQE